MDSLNRFNVSLDKIIYNSFQSMKIPNYTQGSFFILPLPISSEGRLGRMSPVVLKLEPSPNNIERLEKRKENPRLGLYFRIVEPEGQTGDLTDDGLEAPNSCFISVDGPARFLTNEEYIELLQKEKANGDTEIKDWHIKAAQARLKSK